MGIRRRSIQASGLAEAREIFMSTAAKKESRRKRNSNMKGKDRPTIKRTPLAIIQKRGWRKKRVRSSKASARQAPRIQSHHVPSVVPMQNWYWLNWEKAGDMMQKICSKMQIRSVKRRQALSPQ